jgi:hypothetical protein
LPRSQALLEDQLSRITWRDIIFLFQDVHSSSIVMLFCSLAPRYLAETPSIMLENKPALQAASTCQMEGRRQDMMYHLTHLLSWIAHSRMDEELK